ncbi:response regulator transcription factor [Prauserella flavalba]|uniref:response regulator transcription factor n=1 Tax=Prauserella flavalba TaxID=1477506 RepID=UPI0036E7CD72
MAVAQSETGAYSGPRALIVPEDAWQPVAEALRARGYGLRRQPHAPAQMPRYVTRRTPGIAEPATPRRVTGGATLTEREVQVLRGMAQGMRNPAIARELYLAPDTVKTHARTLFRKIGARSRAHAVAIGHQLGILGGDA